MSIHVALGPRYQRAIRTFEDRPAAVLKLTCGERCLAS
jgi:hypothetical protein